MTDIELLERRLAETENTVDVFDALIKAMLALINDLNRKVAELERHDRLEQRLVEAGVIEPDVRELK